MTTAFENMFMNVLTTSMIYTMYQKSWDPMFNTLFNCDQYYNLCTFGDFHAVRNQREHLYWQQILAWQSVILPCNTFTAYATVAEFAC